MSPTYDLAARPPPRSGSWTSAPARSTSSLTAARSPATRGRRPASCSTSSRRAQVRCRHQPVQSCGLPSLRCTVAHGWGLASLNLETQETRYFKISSLDIYDRKTRLSGSQKLRIRGRMQKSCLRPVRLSSSQPAPGRQMQAWARIPTTCRRPRRQEAAVVHGRRGRLRGRHRGHRRRRPQLARLQVVRAVRHCFHGIS